MNIGFKEFKEKLRNTLGEEHVYFSNVGQFYYADYRPKYPEETAGDMIVCFDWANNEASLMMNLQSAIASVVKGSLDDILDKLKKTDFVKGEM